MNRTHAVRIHRPPAAVSDPYGVPAALSWPVAVDSVAGNLQPLTGSVQQSAAGREVGATWRAFLPAGTDVQEDDGLVVLSGVGPTAFRVKQVGEQGAPWDTEVLLDTTEEAITRIAGDTFDRDDAGALGTSSSGIPWGTPVPAVAEGSAPTFGIEDGSALVPAIGDGGFVWLAEDLGTSEVSIAVKVATGQLGNVGIIYGGNGATTPAAARFYLALFMSANRTRLYKWDGTALTLIGQLTYSLVETGDPTAVTITLAEGVHEIGETGGSAALTVEDATYTGGYVGLYASGALSETSVPCWDDLVITPGAS